MVTTDPVRSAFGHHFLLVDHDDGRTFLGQSETGRLTVPENAVGVSATTDDSCNRSVEPVLSGHSFSGGLGAGR